jgi:hypothetical protein
MEVINQEKNFKRTDLKPIKFDFNGSSDELIKKFFFKVKPIEGIVKFHLINWVEFPTELEQAKSLAKDWAKKFSEHKKFNGLVTNIYFHLEKKTIRFEVKKYIVTEIKKFTLVKADLDDFSEQILNYKKQVFDLIESNKGIWLFDSSCWEGLELDKCKELGKLWAQELETREDFAGLKVVVFLNPSKKNIKVTIK